MKCAALLFILLAACSTSWAASKPNDNKNVTLTVNATCTSTAIMRSPSSSLKESVTAVMNETVTYRVVHAEGDPYADLEVVSHTNRLSASGVGTFASGGISKSWGYTIDNQIRTPLAGLDIDYSRGFLVVHPVNFVHAGDLRSTDQTCPAMAGTFADTGITDALSPPLGDPLGEKEFGKQCRKAFKPWPKDLNVTGTATHHFELNTMGSSGGTDYLMGLTVTYTVSNNPPQLVEAVLIPKGDYKGWLPGASTQSGQAGNQISFTAKLRDSKTGEDAKEKTAKFEFELEDVSKEPGSCMNSPWKDTNPDLKFTKDANAGLASVSDAKAESNKGLVTCPITVSCFDGGAHGRLKVLARLDGETKVLTAKFEGTEQVRLPYDIDGNDIADAWESQNGVTGKEAKADEDDQPDGDHDNGDGLTIWEEYRGFLEEGKHIRTDPRKKDFFVCDTMGGQVPKAIDKFKSLTKLDVHGKLKLEELDSSHIINRNHAEGPHVVDQHGVIIVAWSTEGVCEANGGPGTPKSINEVLIDPTIPVNTTITTAAGAKTYPLFVPTVVHELLHCCNVFHHGESDKTVWWTSETVGGKTDVYEFKSIWDTPHPDKGIKIKVYDEADGLAFDATDAFWETPRERWLGSKAGQHSGCEDCVMRYACSQGYTLNSAARYDIVNRGEPVGQTICMYPKGTGVNEKDRKPMSRYGSAAEKRGDCVDQICVNDLYH